MHKKLKPALLASSLCCALLATVASAETTSPAKNQTPAPATTKAAPQGIASPAATKTTAPGQPVQATIQDPLQLTDAQKKKMAAWSALQQQHMQSNLRNQMALEDMAIADSYDEARISKIASDMAEETRHYYEQYARNNRDFIDSLTPEQKTKARQMQKKRHQKMQEQLERMQQQAAQAKSAK